MQGMKFQAFFFFEPLLPWSLNSWHLQVQMFFFIIHVQTLSPMLHWVEIIIIPDVPYKVTIDPRSQLNHDNHDNGYRQPRLPFFILEGEGPFTSQGKGLWWRSLGFFGGSPDGKMWCLRCLTAEGVKFWSLWANFFQMFMSFWVPWCRYWDTFIRLLLAVCARWFFRPYVEECDLQAGSSFITEGQ